MSLPKEPRQKMINIMYLVLTATAGTECICRNIKRLQNQLTAV
jgi:hypothetical protein